MAKKMTLGTLAVFVVWEVLDFIVHGNMLQGTYMETASLWRAQEDMMMGVMMVVVLITAAAFTYIYVALVTPKSMASALKFGLLFGVAAGVSMGYGTYAVQPIPYSLAMAWAVNGIVQGAAAGAVLSFIVKD